MAKIIVFSNLKGGVGKSTLCCHFAHFLVAKNQKVAVLDADLSHNIYNLRQRELAKVKDAVKPWEVWTLDAAASTDAVIERAKTLPGYVLIDCPGTLNDPARYRSTFTTQNKMTMRLNNIYVVGEYFFIDFSVDNKTNLPFDIDELRVKLQDKKQQKATNAQTIELKPALVLDRSVRFKKGYRNIIVLKKMTFPNDKVLSIELSEKQISGRTIFMNLDYEDVLAADAFDTLLLREQ